MWPNKQVKRKRLETCFCLLSRLVFHWLYPPEKKFQCRRSIKSFFIFIFPFVEKERQRQAEKARKEDERRRDDRKKLEVKNKKLNQLDSIVDEDVVTKSEQEATTTSKPRQQMAGKINPKLIKEEMIKKKDKKAKEDLPPYVDAQAVQHMQERPKVAHAQNHQIVHNEAVKNCFFFLFSIQLGFKNLYWSKIKTLIFQGYSVRHEVPHHENRSVYFTLAFAGVALVAAMIVGVVLLKRRHARSPAQQVRPS